MCGRLCLPSEYHALCRKILMAIDSLIKCNGMKERDIRFIGM